MRPEHNFHLFVSSPLDFKEGMPPGENNFSWMSCLVTHAFSPVSHLQGNMSGPMPTSQQQPCLGCASWPLPSILWVEEPFPTGQQMTLHSDSDGFIWRIFSANIKCFRGFLLSS
jgi:hypothetical protein